MAIQSRQISVEQEMHFASIDQPGAIPLLTGRCSKRFLVRDGIGQVGSGHHQDSAGQHRQGHWLVEDEGS